MMMPSINVRIPRSDKEWLTKAAASAGQSLSEFMRVAAIKQAHQITSIRTRPVVRVRMGRLYITYEQQ